MADVLAYSSAFGETALEMKWLTRRLADKTSPRKAARTSYPAEYAGDLHVSRRLFLLPLLLVCVSMQAAGSYNLTLRLQPGMTWSFEQDVEAQQKSYRTVNTEALPDIEQQARSVRRGTISILAATNGVPTAVRVAFDSACGTRVTQTGKEDQQIPYPLAGTTVTLRRGIDGRVTQEFDPEPKNELDPGVRVDLQAYLEGNEGRPTRPVAVGEYWMPTAAQLSNTFRLREPTDVGFSQFRLASILTTNGLRLAHVVVSNYAQTHPAQMVISEQVKGSLWLDLETGRLVESDFDGISGTRGYQMIAGPTGEQTLANVQTIGKSQIRLFTSLRGAPVAMASASPAQTEMPPAKRGAAPPVNSGPSSAGSPVNTAPPAPAPPPSPASPTEPTPTIEAAAFDPWPGTYQDAGLTVQIVAKGTGQYEGSVVLEGRDAPSQTFPLTAHGDARQLAGYFRSGPDSFEFSATLDGRTMNFVTDGTNRYQLRRRVVNPLSRPAATAPPPAPNPLSAAGTRGSAGAVPAQTNRPPASPARR
jgi:hypothetical protein